MQGTPRVPPGAPGEPRPRDRAGGDQRHHAEQASLLVDPDLAEGLSPDTGRLAVSR